MVDVVRGLFVVAALVAAVRARHRFAVSVGVMMLGVIAAEIALLFTLPAGPMPVQFAFGAIFLGPTALAPIDPLHHLFVAGLGTFGARRAFRESAPLHPETGRAHELDRLGLRFVAIAVLHALLSLSGLVGRALGR